MRAAIVAGWLGVTAATPVAGAVLDSAPDGFTVANTVVVPVATEAAWRALVDDVDRWWPVDHTWWGEQATLTIEPRAGGCFCERAGTREAWHMTVTFVDPGRTLRMTGGLGPLQGMGLHGALEFRFEPLAPDRTRVTMWYRAGGYTPDDLAAFAPVVDRVQALQLGGLATFLGGGPETPPPAPPPPG